jgi:organic hydroperoxide reductase OsmC/OhrA
MAQYLAEVIWERGEQPFLDNRYSRKHLLRFDGGVEFPGSSSPHVVPLPMSENAAVDPEETFVASLSSCHMLFFLSIAAKQGFRVDSYHDKAVGTMGKNAAGKMVISEITLRPDARFSGTPVPTREQLESMHHEAHVECFIANSVLSTIHCEPVSAAADVSLRAI